MKYSELLLMMPVHDYFWKIIFRMKEGRVVQFVLKYGSDFYQIISTKRRDSTPPGFCITTLEP